MEKQELLNAIATLTATIDPLIRAGKGEAIDNVVSKIIDIIKKL